MNTKHKPPLHRRFNEPQAIKNITARYQRCYRAIKPQVDVLLQSISFLQKCQDYYENGYKDWTILSAIFSCMMNWRAQELGLNPDFQGHVEKIWKIEETLQEIIYPVERFLQGEADLDVQMKIHCVTALRTYGFELRNNNVDPMVIEEFLRVRMKHFDFDLPHDPLFQTPIGSWPSVVT